MNSFLKPFKESFIFKIIFWMLLFCYASMTNAQADKNSELFKIIKVNDSVVFENAFNHCNLEKLAPIIADNFEFYHDVGGIQDKKQFLEAIKNNLCTKPGNNTRKLIEASLEVFPMKKNGELYGAIQSGKHTFQEKQNGKLITVGIADFTHLWILENKIWKLKRVLSYNHKPYSE